MPTSIGPVRPLDHLSAEDEQSIRRALAFLGDHRRAIPAPRLWLLNDVMDLLVEWRLPARCHHLAIANCALGSIPEGRLNAALEPGIVTAATGQAEVSDAALLGKPLPPGQQPNLRGPLPWLFHLAFNDLEALLVCVAEHVALVRGGRLDERQARLIAESNLHTYGPVLEMLGLWTLRMELGDWALKSAEPGLYERRRAELDAMIANRKPQVEAIRATLGPAFEAAGLKYELFFRPAGVSSIERRVQRGAVLSDLIRQVNVTLIVPTLDDCYRALGIVHRLWPRLAGRGSSGCGFKDMVAAPKYNGYRALITAVQTPRSGPGPASAAPVEFRIVSDEMRRINEWGVLAGRYFPGAPRQDELAWWARTGPTALLAPEEQVTDDGRTVRTIKVLSAAGEVVALPERSTPIDFAYRIHSQVGHHCAHIWINGQTALYSQILKNRDIVEIGVEPRYDGPDRAWLDVVQTVTAKRQIQRALKQARGGPSERGREILVKLLTTELERYHLSDVPREDFERYLAAAARRRHYINVDALLSEFTGPPDERRGRRRISPNELVSEFIAGRLADHIVRRQGEALGIPKNGVRFAECSHEGKPCRAAPGVPIVGRLVHAGTAHERIVIYRRDCPNAPQPEQALPLSWLGDRLTGQPVRVAIKAVDRARLLGSVTEMVYGLYDDGLWLHGVEARVAPDRSASVGLTINANSYRTLELLREALCQLQGKGVIDDFEILGMDPIEKLRLLGPTTLPNPYTQGPAVNRRVFKGRHKEIERIANSLAGERIFLLITGMNRVGKTSLLEFVRQHLAEPSGYVPVFVSLHSLPMHTETGFWTRIGQEIERSVASRSTAKGPQAASRRKQGDTLDFEAFTALLERAESQLGGRLLILLDELNVIEESFAVDVRRETLHHLRSLIERGGRTGFIVTVQERYYRQLEKQKTARPLSWALLRLAEPMRLDYLDQDAAGRLVREPLGDTLEFEPGLVERIIALTAGHPFHIHSLMHLVVEQAEMPGGAAHRVLLTSAHLQAAVAQFMETGYELFIDFMEDYSGKTGRVLGALAWLAGDANQSVSVAGLQEELLRQRRASREETVRELEKLHDVGLVVWEPAGQGPAAAHIRIPLFQQWLRRHRPRVE